MLQETLVEIITKNKKRSREDEVVGDSAAATAAGAATAAAAAATTTKSKRSKKAVTISAIRKMVELRPLVVQEQPQVRGGGVGAVELLLSSLSLFVVRSRMSLSLGVFAVNANITFDCCLIDDVL